MMFQTLRLLEHDPFPAARWLTPAQAEEDMAVNDNRDDVIVQALDSIEEQEE